MQKTQEFKNEIQSRFENPEEWEGSAPFYRGMFWSSIGGRKPDETHFRDWDYKTSHPNLLMLTLGEDTRRSELVAARHAFPAMTAEIKLFEEALDGAGVVFPEEASFFERDRESVGVEFVHEAFLEAFSPPRRDRVNQIAHVAARLKLASDSRLPGVILRIARHYGYFDSFRMRFSDKGYQLQATAREVVTEDRGDAATLQSQRLDIPKTPSVYGSLLSKLADPLHALTGDRNDYGSEKSDPVACIVADMVAHGETAAIIIFGNGEEFALGSLAPDMGIRQISRRIRKLIHNCHQIRGVRALPPERPTHRFYIVGGRIVADTPIGVEHAASGKVSLVEHSRETGPVSISVTLRDDDGARAQMLDFCQSNLGYICQYRGNWIVDVAMGKTKPHLAGIDEIFDGQWYGAVEGIVLEALSAQQAAAFSEKDMALSSFGFTSGAKKNLNMPKDTAVEPCVRHSDAIGSALDILMSLGSNKRTDTKQDETGLDWDHPDLDFLNSKNSKDEEDGFG